MPPRSLYCREYQTLALSDFPEIRRQHAILDALDIPRITEKGVLFLGSRIALLEKEPDPHKRIYFRQLCERTKNSDPSSRFGQEVRAMLETLKAQ